MAHEGFVEARGSRLHPELLVVLLELLDSVNEIAVLGVLIEIVLIKDYRERFNGLDRATGKDLAIKAGLESSFNS